MLFRSWTYTLDERANELEEGHTHEETFQVSVSDGLGGIATQTVSVTIKGTNDVPEFVTNDAIEIQMHEDTLIDNGSVASGTIDLSTAIVNDVDNGDENLYIAQVDGNTVDSINGYTSSVSFTYSVGTDTFTINADVTIKQDGTYTIDNIGDLNPIPDGIQAVEIGRAHV